MLGVLTSTPGLSYQVAAGLRPLAAPSQERSALRSAFLHKPSLKCISGSQIYNIRAARQRNVITASAVTDVIGNLLGRFTGVKIDSSAPEWTATIYTTGEIAKKLQVLDFLDLELVGESGRIDAEKEGKDLAKWERGTWESLDKRMIGQTYTGKVRIPKSIGKPALALFTHTGGEDNPSSFYVSRLVLTSGDSTITFAVNSYIHAKQGKRVFFDETPRLPSETPEFLAAFRAQELKDLRGPAKFDPKVPEPRNDWDRIYQYDVYNDLGNPETNPRPTLGGRKDGAKLAYPRRLRTARGYYPGTTSEKMPSKEQPDYWLPLDERFDPLKQANFERGRKFYGLYALNGILSVLAKDSVVGLPANLKSLKEGTFPSFDSYNSLYKDRDGIVEKAGNVVEKAGSAVSGAIAKALPGLDKGALQTLRAAFGADEENADEFLAGAKQGNFAVGSDADKLINRLRVVVEKLTFTKPFVVEGRDDVWRSDEEWGRETIAGQNPCVISAITSLPPKTKITAKDVEAHMEGLSLADAFKSPTPRVFMIDYSVIFPDYTKEINADEDRFQYAGRAILFLRDDQQLVPVAIELFTGETPPVVYTPSDPANVWLVAKAAFSSIDSGFHQLYSHFCRTHAVIEPACIAARRQLSALHPVYKLLMPHFRFTLNINRNARQTLVSQGGIIESTFTPGKVAMTLSAEVYGALWSFESQALPNDLKARGLAKEGADGKVEMLLPDYPYGSDGMLIWNSVEKWVKDYLSLYYTGAKGASIADDPEINAWWNEFKNEGHPDVTYGWPKLETVDDLTRILTTLIWVASAHHAAVNFGQYDYSGYMPNRSSVVHKQIPAKGTPAYKDLVSNLDKNFFKYFAKPKEAVQVMATVGLLSTHSENEQYINDKEHYYIFEKKARDLYNAHVKAIVEAEAEIARRNADPHSPVRNPSKGGLPYKLLIPSSGPGVTGQGIPTSISI